MKSYFLLFNPDDSGDTYDDDDDTVEYKLSLQELALPTGPCTVLEYFQHLLAHPSPEEFLKSSLKQEWVDGLHTTYDPEFSEESDPVPPSPDAVADWGKLCAWLKEHVCIERHFDFTERAIVIGTTREFDIEYAFFSADAVAKGDLKLLGQWVEVDGDGNVTLKCDKVRHSAYL
eukprot:GDKI01021715.1.p1 GENE.GDKI01021715.1~~GDKI01021715.1.p1  ORF type:complete len:174 (-),score=65.25 GDKI01021715.1:96-617(-)